MDTSEWNSKIWIFNFFDLKKLKTSHFFSFSMIFRSKNSKINFFPISKNYLKFATELLKHFFLYSYLWFFNHNWNLRNHVFCTVRHLPYCAHEDCHFLKRDVRHLPYCAHEKFWKLKFFKFFRVSKITSNYVQKHLTNLVQHQ